jgi:hypothetical protein
MGNLSSLQAYIESLMRTKSDDGAFLIVTLSGTEDFLQLVGDAAGVQLDFPLVTGRQLSFEAAFRVVAEREGLIIDEVKEGDSRFLNINLSTNPAEVSRITRTFLQDVFRVNATTNLEFELEGVDE